MRPGDRVGVAALSGPLDPHGLERGLDALRASGFEPAPAANLTSRRGLFAGSDDERLAGLHALAADREVRAIFLARGGHGLLRLLPRFDWPLLARRPLAWVGYSDATPLLNELVHRLGVATFHGPMVAVEWAAGLEPAESDSLLAALAGELPRTLPLASVVGDGGFSGPLRGGCLSLLAAAVGTPFAPRLDGSVLFWEDVDEPAYRLDRMLTQLELAGHLDGLRGMVVGTLEPPAEDPHFAAALLETLGELGRRHGWPVARGCPAGHCRPNLTLPLGLGARLEPGAGELVVGEPG